MHACVGPTLFSKKYIPIQLNTILNYSYDLRYNWNCIIVSDMVCFMRERERESCALRCPYIMFDAAEY